MQAYQWCTNLFWPVMLLGTIVEKSDSYITDIMDILAQEQHKQLVLNCCIRWWNPLDVGEYFHASPILRSVIIYVEEWCERCWEETDGWRKRADKIWSYPMWVLWCVMFAEVRINLLITVVPVHDFIMKSSKWNLRVSTVRTWDCASGLRSHRWLTTGI